MTSPRAEGAASGDVQAAATLRETDTDPEADAHVRKVVRESGSSFLTAMRLLRRDRREAMYAIYAFCREIDDIADGAAPTAEKRKQLKAWRAEIGRLFGGRPRYLTARALARHVARYDLERQDFMDLIDGMMMDATEDIRAPSLEHLDRYCDRVASAAGRLSVRAFGAAGGAALKVAHHLGRALQLTNILRDLGEDADRGRLYLPAPLLDGAGIAEREPRAVLADPRVGAVCAALAERAREHYVRAAQSLRACPRRPMRPARLMMHVYGDALRRLEARGWERIDEPAPVPRWRKLWLVLRYGLV